MSSTEVVSGGIYRITNAKADTVVDLSGFDNRSIIGYPWHSGDNQRWVFTWVGAAWTIRSVASGLYIGISTPTTEAATNGTLLVATEVPFNWHIWHDENDEESFRIFAPFTYYNWDLYGYGRTEPGTAIQLWRQWNGEHQTWIFERA